MKKILILIMILTSNNQLFAQTEYLNNGNSYSKELNTMEPISEIIIPILFIVFLIFMIISLIKYFLDYKLKNKLIDKGLSEQLIALVNANDSKEKKNDAIKYSILCFGIALGFIITYFTAPINLHSLAIMTFSIGISYFAYFLHLKNNN